MLKTWSRNQGKKVGAQRWPGWVSCPRCLAGGAHHTRSSCSPTPVSPYYLSSPGTPDFPASDIRESESLCPKIISNCTWTAIFLWNTFKNSRTGLIHLILFLLEQEQSCQLWGICSLGVWGCRYDILLQIRLKELGSRYWTYWLMHLNKLSNIIGTKGGFTSNKIKFPRKLVWEGASFQSFSTTFSSRSELWLDVSDAISPYSKKTLPRKTLFLLKYIKYSIQSHY